MAASKARPRVAARSRQGKTPARPRARLTPALRKEIARAAVQAVALAAPRETDETFILGARAAANQNWRDRFDYKRDEILLDALLIWRDNPLARRIVGLTTQYVVGGGLVPFSEHADTDKFLKTLWEHRQNRMPIRCIELCDELTRAGNLFILLSTDPAGMSYVRAVPAADIQKIEHKENDVEQETAFLPRATAEVPDPKPYPAYDEDTDAPDAEGGKWSAVMLHYAVNRPVGAQWGEPDLGPLIRWITRFDGWLEDRVRLNRFRYAFNYVLTGKYPNEADRARRMHELNLNPPVPGGFFVKDESESLGILHPQLDSFEASEDGLAVKKHIAAGSGNPLHFLAEPESSTRTTAEASGGPSYRHYEQRQLNFLWMLRDVLHVARRRRAIAGGRLSQKASIILRAGDISQRDNAALALAASRIVAGFALLRDRGLIDDAELLRMCYRFAGELVDVEELLARGKVAPPPVGAKPEAPASPAAEPDGQTPDPEQPGEKPDDDAEAADGTLSRRRNGRHPVGADPRVGPSA